MSIYNYRNVYVRRNGRVDCEIEILPDQWVPFTASEDEPMFQVLTDLPDDQKEFEPQLTPEEIAEAELIEWRQSAYISQVNFGIAVMLAGIVTEAEAEAWVSGTGLPTVVQSALDTIPDPTEKAIAKLRVRGSTTVYRNDPMVLFLQSHLGLSDAQVDSLFGR